MLIDSDDGDCLSVQTQVAEGNLISAPPEVKGEGRGEDSSQEDPSQQRQPVRDTGSEEHTTQPHAGGMGGGRGGRGGGRKAGREGGREGEKREEGRERGREGEKREEGREGGREGEKREEGREGGREGKGV